MPTTFNVDNFFTNDTAEDIAKGDAMNLRILVSTFARVSEMQGLIKGLHMQKLDRPAGQCAKDDEPCVWCEDFADNNKWRSQLERQMLLHMGVD